MWESAIGLYQSGCRSVPLASISQDVPLASVRVRMWESVPLASISQDVGECTTGLCKGQDVGVCTTGLYQSGCGRVSLHLHPWVTTAFCSVKCTLAIRNVFKCILFFLCYSFFVTLFWGLLSVRMWESVPFAPVRFIYFST